MAKFKVGDKVRVVKTIGHDCKFKIGDIGNVTDISNLKVSYPITVELLKNGIQELLSEEELEIYNEDKMGKTFREVITDIKPGETWDSGNRKIGMNEKGQIFIDGLSILKCFEPNVKYYLKRKEYTFEEAFKAYEEGKEIESVFSKYRYKKENGKDIYINSIDSDVFDWFELDEIRGKWYIND